LRLWGDQLYLSGDSPPTAPNSINASSPNYCVVKPRNTIGSAFSRSGKKRMVCMPVPYRMISAEGLSS